MNARLLAETPLTAILVCYEDGEDCPRRKPNPGLLLEAAETYSIDLAASLWSGTAGGTSRPDNVPGAGRCSSTGLRRAPARPARRLYGHGSASRRGLDTFSNPNQRMKP